MYGPFPTIAALLSHILATWKEENWGKREFFQVRNGHLCTCPHGQAQSLINPKINPAECDPLTANFIINDLRVGSIISQADQEITHGFSDGDILLFLRSLWEERSPRQQDPLLAPNYFLGFFISPSFNDHPFATFSMIQERLRQAIGVAAQLGI